MLIVHLLAPFLPDSFSLFHSSVPEAARLLSLPHYPAGAASRPRSPPAVGTIWGCHGGGSVGRRGGFGPIVRLTTSKKRKRPDEDEDAAEVGDEEAGTGWVMKRMPWEEDAVDLMR